MYYKVNATLFVTLTVLFKVLQIQKDKLLISVFSLVVVNFLDNNKNVNMKKGCILKEEHFEGNSSENGSS